MARHNTDPAEPTPELLAELDLVIRDIPADKVAAMIAALAAKIGLASAKILALPSGDNTVTPDENLSAPEAARRLGVSADYLYRNARKLPFTVRIGRRLLFSARGLDRWNKNRQGR